VAARVGTILDADKIVVLEKGKVSGIGKHKQLMKSCKTYKDIVLSQISAKEAAHG
jgi:ATP-binding cassette subfamily B protein